MSNNKFTNTGTNLALIQEESAEVIIEACKITRFGPDNWNPEDPERTPNIKRLGREMADQLVAIEIMVNDPNINLSWDEIEQFKKEKYAKLDKFYM